MITTEDVRRASRTGEPLRMGPLVVTLDNLVRLPASDWDDWMELRPFAARREARRLNSVAKYMGMRHTEPEGPAAEPFIEGEVVEQVAAIEPPRVRKRATVSTSA